MLKRKKIIVMAEDETDCKTISVFIKRILGENADKFTVKSRAPAHGGCAILRRKAKFWMKEASEDGFHAAILVHDLDRNPFNGSLNDLQKLSRTLNSIETPVTLKKHICIPIEEIEAWFWSDPIVVKRVGRGNGKAHNSPHLIAKPKEKLIKLSENAGGKPLYDTNDNYVLAGILNLQLCSEKSESFRNFNNFITGLANS
jgi:Domain of unknown function (DUF4276)